MWMGMWAAPQSVSMAMTCHICHVAMLQPSYTQNITNYVWVIDRSWTRMHIQVRSLGFKQPLAANCQVRMLLVGLFVQCFHPPWGVPKNIKHTLVGGLEHGFYFSIQLGMSSSQLTNSIIFQRGRSTTNQTWLQFGHRKALTHRCPWGDDSSAGGGQAISAAWWKPCCDPWKGHDKMNEREYIYIIYIYTHIYILQSYIITCYFVYVAFFGGKSWQSLNVWFWKILESTAKGRR